MIFNNGEEIQFDFNSIKRRNQNEHKSEFVRDIRIRCLKTFIPFYSNTLTLLATERTFTMGQLIILYAENLNITPQSQCEICMNCCSLAGESHSNGILIKY